MKAGRVRKERSDERKEGSDDTERNINTMMKMSRWLLSS